MKFPCLAIADLHAQLNNLKEISFLFKHQLTSMFKTKKCKSLLICGDIFDSVSVIHTEVYITVYKLIEDFQKKTNAEVHLIAGNHDLYMINNEILPPIDPLNNFSRLHLSYDVEDNVEFIAFGVIPEKLLDKPGITFMHGYLPQIVSHFNFSFVKPENVLCNISKNRTYVSGHIHTPYVGKNQISLGCPVPVKFDFSEFDTNIWVINLNNDKVKIDQFKCNVSKYNIFNIKDPSDLENLTIEEGEVSTWIKLKLNSPEITSLHIREFRKKCPSNWKITTVRDYQLSQLKKKILENPDKNPVSIYKSFLANTENTPFDKRELWKLISNIIQENSNEKNTIHKLAN